MGKIIINPEYVVKAGKPTCDHERTVIQLGGVIYEFCDECKVCWVREEGDSDGN